MLRACRSPGCPREAVRRGLCEEHARRDEARRRAQRVGFIYSSVTWRRLRDAFLRQNPECAICGGRATEAHHRVPRRMGGPDEPDNLVALCRRCHARITGRGG